MHLRFVQASLLGHSLLLIHSGLQFGGEPKNSGKQEHEGELFETLHSEFGPQGDGRQGFPVSSGRSLAKRTITIVPFVKLNS